MSALFVPVPVLKGKPVKTITIPLRDGSTTTIPVRAIAGPLAMHACVGVIQNPETYGSRGTHPLPFPWVITHVPSGRSIGRGFRTLKAAGRALAIMAAWDWSRVAIGVLDVSSLKSEFLSLRSTMGADMDAG
jgi:hypothetical protein